MFNITGTLKVKFDEQKVSERFRKRDFVIQENSSQYPQLISFQLVQDRCNLIDNFKENDEVRVFFNLRGREWKSPQGETKYFNTIEAWKIESVSAAPHQTAGVSNTVAAPDVTTFSSGESDDLPF
jgi:translation initiation factor IF-3